MEQQSEIGSFFMTLLTISHGNLVCCGSVVEKHCSAQHDLDFHWTKTKDASAKSDQPEELPDGPSSASPAVLNCGGCCVCRTHLSSLFNLLLLSVPLLHVPHEQALTQELLGSAGGLNVQKGIVGVLNHALPKGTNAKLNHGSVVEDLNERERESARVIAELVVFLFYSSSPRLPT